MQDKIFLRDLDTAHYHRYLYIAKLLNLPRRKGLVETDKEGQKIMARRRYIVLSDLKKWKQHIDNSISSGKFYYSDRETLKVINDKMKELQDEEILLQ